MAGTSEADTPTFAAEHDPKLRLLIPVIVAIGFGMEGIDTTIITTAIPAMAKALQSTSLQMSLAVTAYVLVLAVFIPVSGWFADRFSARRVFAVAPGDQRHLAGQIERLERRLTRSAFVFGSP